MSRGIVKCEKFEDLPIVTAGESGVRYPPLFNKAMRSVSPAFVIVAGSEIGMVNTASII
jgi:hypothetical protein